MQPPWLGKSTWGEVLVLVHSVGFMVAARGMEAVHLISAKAVELLLVTFFNSCRTWTLLRLTPRGKLDSLCLVLHHLNQASCFQLFLLEIIFLEMLPCLLFHPYHLCRITRYFLHSNNEIFWFVSFNLFFVSGRRITSSGQRDLDQVAGRIVVAPWISGRLSCDSADSTDLIFCRLMLVNGRDFAKC